MNENTDEFKGKVKHQLRESRLDFVVPLPLLECISRLEQADKTLPTRFYIYYDDAKRASLKQVRFIILVKNPQLSTRVEGMIKQKDENFTGFTGTAEFVHETNPGIKIRQNISSLCFIIIMIAGFALTFRHSWVGGNLICLLNVAIYFSLLLVLDSRNTTIKMQQLTEAIQRQLLFE